MYIASMDVCLAEVIIYIYIYIYMCVCVYVLYIYIYIYIYLFSCVLSSILFQMGDRGSTVVKVLYYKLVGRWFDPSWCQWIFL